VGRWGEVFGVEGGKGRWKGKRQGWDEHEKKKIPYLGLTDGQGGGPVPLAKKKSKGRKGGVGLRKREPEGGVLPANGGKNEDVAGGRVNTLEESQASENCGGREGKWGRHQTGNGGWGGPPCPLKKGRRRLQGPGGSGCNDMKKSLGFLREKKRARKRGGGGEPSDRQAGGKKEIRGCDGWGGSQEGRARCEKKGGLCTLVKKKEPEWKRVIRKGGKRKNGIDTGGGRNMGGGQKGAPWNCWYMKKREREKDNSSGEEGGSVNGRKKREAS